MIKTNTKKQILNNFLFKYKNKEYLVDIQKLLKVLMAMNFDYDKTTFDSNKNFEIYLKKHGLLIEEFIEYIAIS